MNAMMRQVQQFQEEREALAAELEEKEYEIAAGGGAVKLKINGAKTVTELKIPRSSTRTIPRLLRTSSPPP